MHSPQEHASTHSSYNSNPPQYPVGPTQAIEHMRERAVGLTLQAELLAELLTLQAELLAELLTLQAELLAELLTLHAEQLAELLTLQAELLAELLTLQAELLTLQAEQLRTSPLCTLVPVTGGGQRADWSPPVTDSTNYTTGPGRAVGRASLSDLLSSIGTPSLIFSSYSTGFSIEMHIRTEGSMRLMVFFFLYNHPPSGSVGSHGFPVRALGLDQDLL